MILPPPAQEKLDTLLASRQGWQAAWQIILTLLSSHHQEHITLDDLLYLQQQHGVSAANVLQPLLKAVCRTLPDYVRWEDVRFAPTLPVTDRWFIFKQGISPFMGAL